MCRYLTPTEEIIERKDAELEKQETTADDAPKISELEGPPNAPRVAFREQGQGDVNDKETPGDGDAKKSEVVPIAETSAVPVELEPSNNESSLGETNVQSSDAIEEEKTTAAGLEKEEVPPVESIPTISQFCDPSHYESTTNTVTDVVTKNAEVKTSESVGSPEKVLSKAAEAKRRVSLPNNHSESQTTEFTKECGARQVSPQKRPRSASTSTQVDPNLFGKCHLNLFLIMCFIFGEQIFLSTKFG